MLDQGKQGLSGESSGFFLEKIGPDRVSVEESGKEVDGSGGFGRGSRRSGLLLFLSIRK
jgi:hypothetical protein